jgi:RNA ligase (TIGR02306 family)
MVITITGNTGVRGPTAVPAHDRGILTPAIQSGPVGLAYIGQVIEISEIPGADLIESATVICGKGGKWIGTVQKETLHVGDFCEVYLRDALLPSDVDRFKFLEKHKMRVAMRRFKGVPSECLVMPLEVLEDPASAFVGLDITDLVGVQKYERPLPSSVGGNIKGHFPSFIPKTDELDFQRVPHMIEFLRENAIPIYVTLKMDGSSGTVWKWRDEFGVASRNFELCETEGNVFWQIARLHKLYNILPNGIAVQFEACGPGIQGNPLGLLRPAAFLFNVWDITEQRYASFRQIQRVVYALNMDMVPLIARDLNFATTPEFESDEGLRHYAERNYPHGPRAEGIVIRPMVERNVAGGRLSFKVINLLYKESSE